NQNFLTDSLKRKRTRGCAGLSMNIWSSEFILLMVSVGQGKTLVYLTFTMNINKYFIRHSV
ncbi:MAG TPA: hypothetical protein DER18_01585, partial [Shewanella baltica]|nr:hypothetical protein [Shewanella baltica]